MMHLTPRAKFLDNTHNKSEIIHLLSSAFQKHQITVELYDNDADTSIVKAALAAAKDDSVEVSEPRAGADPEFGKRGGTLLKNS